MPIPDQERRDDALRWVEGFDPADPCGTRSRHLTLDLLRNASRPFDRSHFHPGHVTASGLVLSGEGRKVLLVYHNRLQMWLQPGGHVEPEDRSVVGTAVREVWEETGIRVVPDDDPPLVSVDVHRIPATPAEPPHHHHDLMFRFTATDDAIDAPAEAREVVWCPVADLSAYDVDGALRRGVGRALDTVSEGGRPGR